MYEIMTKIKEKPDNSIIIFRDINNLLFIMSRKTKNNLNKIIELSNNIKN